ncbi:hypothetical protein BDV26DRAFT_304697 [Aspergillus bertholletiae]|uniref:Uncharacterized protein n=1 Tax=Aspergillus bertholletiae TaxID=1226010 RepID=A0A5N7B890_9EURO|nr:hypothetical protein BDV26DRAFT_304697 [Aspergillus bertholletiae]
MRFEHLFLTLGAALTARAASDPGQCYTISQMYLSTDKASGRAQCCPDGTLYNGLSCQPLPICSGANQYYDIIDRVCRDALDCDPGYFFFARDKTCKRIPVCLDDEFFDGQYCVRKPQCKDGYYFKETGCVPKPVCENDEFFDGNSCVERPPPCDAGKYWDLKLNQCVPIPDCGIDSYWTGTGCARRPRCQNPEYYFNGIHCVPCQDPRQYWNGNACVPRPICDSTQYLDGNVCKPIPRCGPGEYWSRSKRICDRIPPCSLGQWFNGERCEDISYPPYGGRLCVVKCEETANLPVP